MKKGEWEESKDRIKRKKGGREGAEKYCRRGEAERVRRRNDMEGEREKRVASRNEMGGEGRMGGRGGCEEGLEWEDKIRKKDHKERIRGKRREAESVQRDKSNGQSNTGRKAVK